MGILVQSFYWQRETGNKNIYRWNEQISPLVPITCKFQSKQSHCVIIATPYLTFNACMFTVYRGEPYSSGRREWRSRGTSGGLP